MSSTSTTKIPTKWLPQLLDCIICQKESWIEYEKLNQDDSFLIKEEEEDISICNYIKRNCIYKDKGITSISFSHMEQELRFLDMLVNQSQDLQVRIDGLEEDIQYLGKKIGSNEMNKEKLDKIRNEMRDSEEKSAYEKLQLETLNKYIEIIDPDRTRRSLLRARHAKAYREYGAKERRQAREIIKLCDLYDV